VLDGVFIAATSATTVARIGPRLRPRSPAPCVASSSWSVCKIHYQNQIVMKFSSRYLQPNWRYFGIAGIKLRISAKLSLLTCPVKSTELSDDSRARETLSRAEPQTLSF
jgi:hypothetical protein